MTLKEFGLDIKFTQTESTVILRMDSSIVVESSDWVSNDPKGRKLFHNVKGLKSNVFLYERLHK